MRAILISGLVLGVTLFGGTGSAAAVPLRVATPPAAGISRLLVPARHHHRHRGHGRHGYSRAFEYDTPYADTPAAEGQPNPMSAYPRPEAEAPPPPAAEHGGRTQTATRPSIRWVNPDR